MNTTGTAIARIELVFRRNDGISSSHVLEDGGYVLIGASEVCGITLRDPTLAAIHCAVRREGSELWIEDWESDQGVVVNDQKIQEQTPIGPGSEIRIGEYLLSVQSGSAPDEMPVTDGVDSSEELLPLEPESNLDLPAADPATVEPRDVGFSTVEPTKFEPLDSVSRVASNAEAFTFTPEPALPLDDSEAAESVEFLRAEVAQLQYELAERDAQLAELTEMSAGRSRDLDDDDEEDRVLLARLEEMLVELEQSDQQSAVLERMLASSEEKSRAEQEESRQLTAWVDDIEARLSEREAEWRAEQEALQYRVNSALQERDQLLQQLTERAQSDDAPLGSAEAEELRTMNLQLRQSLHQSEDKLAHLEQQLRERDQQLAARSEAESALREEHLKLAQERAALARQQAEMATAQSANANHPNRPETEIDCRLREFRQHLREIHAEEQQTRTTMADRISRLWARLDGAEGR